MENQVHRSTTLNLMLTMLMPIHLMLRLNHRRVTGAIVPQHLMLTLLQTV
jgi:hypothetical protein